MRTVRARLATAGPGDAAPTWKSMGRSAGVKMLVLPMSAFLGIVITRLIIDNFGEAAFAQYGLLVGIGALLPFADLGVSAALMNAIGEADEPGHDDHVRKVLITALRVLTTSATVLVVLSIVFALTGLWPNLLGDGLDPDSGPVIAAMCLSMVGITMPFGIGQRILAGLGRNHVSIALQGLQSPIVLTVILVALGLGVTSGAFVAVVPFVATFIIACLALLIASRSVSPVLGEALHGAPHVRTVRGGRVLDVAWPMVVQSIALPIAMQTDRIVLSHVAGVSELAQYNLASQMFTPIWAVVSAAGITLWPVFAKARAKGERASPIPLSLVFGVAAALLALAVSLFSPFLARVASDGVISLDVGLVVTFSFFMVFQALKYPLGIYMTDPPGLRYQAYMILMMVPVNLGISIVLAREFGAAGPVIGSAIGVFVFQVLANLHYVRRAQRRAVASP